MGQSDSKRSSAKSFINSPDDVSQESIEGFLLTSTVPLSICDAFPEMRVIVRADWDKDSGKVAIITCGGAGHEPADVEFVGEGFLTATACGRVFRPPTCAEIAQAIAIVTGAAGCLVVMKNYVAARLNVGLAMELAEEKRGLRSKIIYVKDDVVTMIGGSKDTARGIAGIVPVLKIAAAAADSGLSLDDVYEEVQAAASSTVSIGVAYNRGTAYIEAWTSATEPIPEGCMEVGVGVHGEPGFLRVTATATARDIVNTMLAKLEPLLPTSGPLCVMLNNLGAVPRIEMSLLAKEVLQSSLASRVELFIGPAALYTALNTNGFSLTVLPLAGRRSEWLTAPTQCRAWIPPVIPKLSLASFPRIPKAPFPEEHSEVITPSDHPVVRRLLQQVCVFLTEAREEIGNLSVKTGTGKLGRTICVFADRLLTQLPQLPLASPRLLFLELSRHCSFETGVLFSLSRCIFTTAANSLMGSKDVWDLDTVVTALRRGAREAQKIAGVELNRRTFFDALMPALAVNCAGVASEASWLEMAAAQARKGARATGNMIQGSDSAAFAPLALRAGSPDGGAMVVAVVFTALDTPPNERFSVLPSGEEGELIKESPEKREKRARQELETLYGMKREIPCEGSFRRMRNAISLKGPRAGTEVIVSELQSQDMEKIGLKRFQASRIIDQRRMLNWLFRPKPNVAEVLEVIVTPLTYIYVTEALPGPSLMDLLVSDEKQSYRRIAELLRQILTAVASLHHSRLIHRDLKPESFSFDKSGALKLTDVCGMVCHLSESYEAEFEQGIICGTLAYMSPEALVGCARQSSDMWAVGVILHLMLIGVLPFHVSTIAQAVEAHRQSVETLKGQFKELWADVPREGQELVERLLQRNVRNRITVDQALKHPFLVHADTGLALANNKALKHPVLVHAETGLALANKKVPSPMEEGPLTSLRRVVSLGLIHEAYSHCKASGESKVSWAASVEAELKPVSKTLYLIRHGEAIHNIEEKRAKRRAAEAALAAGIKRGTKEFEEAVEAARKSVLQNPDFYDAMLSHAGLLDAERCKCELAGLFERGLPMPTAILTSPLQRTLQTASAIFPYHSNVHVREDVRERRTLLPCDTRSRASDMSSRPSFRQLDFNGVPDLDPNEDVAEDSRALRMRCAKFLSGLPSMSAVDATGFDRHHDSICVVTHKGFLRELERGPLGHPESSEFNNCEVRVYLLVWKPNGEIETPAKCIYSNASLSTVQMRNFPVSWVAPDALEALPRRVEALLSDFGELRQPPEVSEDPGGGIRVTAVFTEQSAAAAAALKLNGVDCRCEDEKKARPTAYEADRFCVQVLYDIL